MGKWKDKFDDYFRDSYFQKYGDRLASLSGTAVSVKFTEKNYLVANRLVVDMIVKPDASRGVVKCRYKRLRWFKKPEFIPIQKGHKLMVMGLKGEKKESDLILIQNVLNLTNKRDLVPIDHSQLKKSRGPQGGRPRF